MSTRKIKVNGNLTKFSFDKTKKYKYDSSGDLVEATTISDDDIVLSGSKSSLRRMADMERNISILATKTVTSAGTLDVSIGEVDGLQSALNGKASTSSVTSAISTASGDATGKANAALVSAKAYTDSEITGLLNGAPAAYDTLNEIRNAMATDSELSTAISNISNVPSASRWQTSRTLSLTGDVSGSVSWNGSSNASISVTVADDSHNHVWGNIDGASVSGLLGPRFTTAHGYVEFGPANTSHAHIYTDRPDFYFNKELKINNNLVWNAGNDGSGSGLDADLLDGVQGSSYLRSDGNDTMSGNLSLHGNLLMTGSATTANQARMIDFTGFDKEGTTDPSDRAYIQHTTNTGGFGGSVLVISSQNDSNDGIAFSTNGSSHLRHNSNVIWTAGNDGSGSGLDADLLDGQHGSYYATASAVSTAQAAATAAQTTADSKVGGGEYHNYGSIQIGSTVTTTALLIADLTSKGFFNQHHSVGKCSWNYAGNGDLTDTGFGTFELAGCVVETFSEGENKHVRITRPTTGGDGPSVLVYNDQANGTYSPGWREMVTTYAGSTNITGDLNATGEVTAYYSDERLKNFSGKIENALDKVNTLNGYHYTGNEKAVELGYDDTTPQVGFSAQEVEAVLPEVVKSAPINKSHDTDYKTVQYERILPLLVEAIKEMTSEMNELKKELSELKSSK